MKRVLVVDDEPVIRSLIEASLGGPGCAVEAVGDGPAAIEQATASKPDLILLDLGLPGMDGREVARRLKEDARTAAIPILYLTGLAPTACAPAEGVIAKPFSLDTLQKSTERWLKET